MNRVHNFGAGPAQLPIEVLQSAAQEFLDYKGLGLSILELGHRSSEFEEVLASAKERLIRLLNIPEDYDILFLQGGATLLFAGIPLNLLHYKAGYLISGNFSNKAYLEATKYGNAEILANSKDQDFREVPSLDSCPQDLDYVHICQNNTIYGTQYHRLPTTGDVPLIADVSSCFLSAPMDISKYGAIYAGVQKNAGPAGLSITVIKKSLVKKAQDICPTYLDFGLQLKQNSMLNTPNTWAIYLTNKVFEWIENAGGLAQMEMRNREKSQLLYDFLDESQLFSARAKPSSRSIANVVFSTGSEELDAEVIAEAKKENIVGIQGHRLIGGMRASCYNAVPKSSVLALRDLLYQFEKNKR